MTFPSPLQIRLILGQSNRPVRVIERRMDVCTSCAGVGERYPHPHADEMEICDRCEGCGLVISERESIASSPVGGVWIEVSPGTRHEARLAGFRLDDVVDRFKTSRAPGARPVQPPAPSSGLPF